MSALAAAAHGDQAHDLLVTPPGPSSPVDWCDVLIDFTSAIPASPGAGPGGDEASTEPVQQCALRPVVSGGPFAGLSGTGGVWVSRPAHKRTQARRPPDLMLVDTGSVRVGFSWPQRSRVRRPSRLVFPLLEALDPPVLTDLETGAALAPLPVPEGFIEACLAQSASAWPLFVRAVESLAAARAADTPLQQATVLHHLGLAAVGLTTGDLPAPWTGQVQHTTLGWELQPWLAYGWDPASACRWLDLDPASSAESHLRRLRAVRRWTAHEVGEFTAWATTHRASFEDLTDAEMLDWFKTAADMVVDESGNETTSPRLPWVQVFRDQGVRDAVTYRLFHHVGLMAELEPFLARLGKAPEQTQGVLWDYVEAWARVMDLPSAAWAVAAGVSLAEAEATYAPNRPDAGGAARRPDRGALSLLAGFRPRTGPEAMYLDEFLACHRP